MGPESGDSWTPRASANGWYNHAMLAEERRQRLVAAMREAGISHMVLYGNAWQGDYLRYGADFGILEGHGIALIAADGEVELFLDSATDAERADTAAALQSATGIIRSEVGKQVGLRHTPSLELSLIHI